MRLLKIGICAAAFTVFLSPGASADSYDKLTYLTFSGPVQMPGVEMPAGTYTFKLVDTGTSRTVIQVQEKTNRKPIGMFITIPDHRMEATDNPVVLFRETAAGQPQAVKSWFYPGEKTGFEFLYPHDQALRIARGTGEAVLSMASASSTSSSAEISSIEATDAETSGTTSEETVAQVTSQPSEELQPSAVGTNGELSAEARHLPRTASPLPLAELLSGLAFAGAIGMRQLRHRFGQNV